MRLQQFTISFFLIGLSIFYGFAVFSDIWEQDNYWNKAFYLWYKGSDVLLIAVIWKTVNNKYLIKYWKILFWFCIARFGWQIAITFFENELKGKVTDIVMFIFWCITLIIYAINYKKQ